MPEGKVLRQEGRMHQGKVLPEEGLTPAYSASFSLTRILYPGFFRVSEVKSAKFCQKDRKKCEKSEICIVKRVKRE
jgi:hypothetical protein